MIFPVVAFSLNDDNSEKALVVQILIYNQGAWEMKLEKINLILLLAMAFVLGTFANSFASDNVEWDVYKTLKLEESPIDVAVSPDGKRIFVLTDRGKVVIYSSTGKIEAKMDVGQHVDQLKLGPRGDSLILSSGKNKTVDIVTVDFIQNINVSGSPFKGPLNYQDGKPFVQTGQTAKDKQIWFMEQLLEGIDSQSLQK